MPAPSINWTVEKIDDLTRLWAGGQSAKDIGAEMRITRSTVLGKVHRLGLDKRGLTRLTDAEREERRQRKNARSTVTKRIWRQKQGSKRMQEPTPVVAAPAFVGSLNIPFGDLRRQSSSEANQCRYIAAEPGGPDYLACGNETLPGESWCGHRRAIVYAKPVSISDEERARRSGQASRNWKAAEIKRHGPSEVAA